MRLNKFAGIAASTIFSGALVLGMATSAGASSAPDLGSVTGSLGSLFGSQDEGCNEYVTGTSFDEWSAPGDEVAAELTDDGLLFANHEGKPTSLYKRVGLVDLDTLAADDFSFTYQVDKGVVPALQVRVLDAAESKFEGSGFATLVWAPEVDEEKVGKWVTVTGKDLLDSNDWWITGTNAAERRTFEEIKDANADARVEQVGLQLWKGAEETVTYVSEFTYKGCTSTFTPAPATGSLGSLFGSLS